MSQGKTQKKILDAAEALFAQEGFHSTSLRMLTKKAGVNLAAVNYHFGSKEELIRAVIERRLLPLNRLRFEKLRLPEPVIAIRLRGGTTQALVTEPQRLQFHGRKARVKRYSITQLAERLSARIGEHSVSGVSTIAEHRPQQAWRSHSLLSDKPADALVTFADGCERPLWVLPEPAVLSDRGGCPFFHGRLTLLEGPERLETGWWDDDSITRDYYLAVNPGGRRLWIYRNRRRNEAHWYLHGIFG